MNAISAFQRGVLIGAHGCKCLLRVVNDSVFACAFLCGLRITNEIELSYRNIFRR